MHKHNAERNAKGFTCWGQLVAMLFCQLGSVNSLRDISNGLAASEGKLRHLGLPEAPFWSSIAATTATPGLNGSPPKASSSLPA
ncbi:MAG: DUF4372 domain-containing protein [Acidobacteriota bacterium]